MDTANVCDIFCCPECRSTSLQHTTNLTPGASPLETSEGFHCGGCGREFPRVGHVYVMWSDQVKSIYRNAPAGPALNSQVKKANIEVYQHASQHYGEHTQPNHLQNIRKFKALVKSRMARASHIQAPVVVDVGCATGVGLDEEVLDDALVIGVDISLGNLLEIDAQRHVAVLADAEKLPFREESVDRITCFAAMHHFPEPPTFIAECHRCLRIGGACLTSDDPSRASQRISPLAKLVFDLRRPVYRTLARWSSRFHLHRDADFQQTNDLAEYQRTRGGFDPNELSEMFRLAGFTSCDVFLGKSPSAHRGWRVPNWKTFVLKVLSFQNPFLAANCASVSAVGIKISSDARDGQRATKAA